MGPGKAFGAFANGRRTGFSFSASPKGLQGGQDAASWGGSLVSTGVPGDCSDSACPALDAELSPMSGFIDKLKLKEQADEDLYFARRDRELLRARKGSAPRPFDGGCVKVVSGGQTGVDRAALEAALALGLSVGGWCPAGRRAEDGVIPDCFPLQETPSPDYAERTEWNVRDCDATLIVHRGSLAGGTKLTAELARRYGRPLLCLDLSVRGDTSEVVRWLRLNKVATLNCAGPRESQMPGIQTQARDLLLRLFLAWTGAES
jgi:hypothetical protein